VRKLAIQPDYHLDKNRKRGTCTSFQQKLSQACRSYSVPMTASPLCRSGCLAFSLLLLNSAVALNDHRPIRRRATTEKDSNKIPAIKVLGNTFERIPESVESEHQRRYLDADRDNTDPTTAWMGPFLERSGVQKPPARSSKMKNSKSFEEEGYSGMSVWRQKILERNGVDGVEEQESDHDGDWMAMNDLLQRNGDAAGARMKKQSNSQDQQSDWLEDVLVENGLGDIAKQSKTNTEKAQFLTDMFENYGIPGPDANDSNFGRPGSEKREKGRGPSAFASRQDPKGGKRGRIKGKGFSHRGSPFPSSKKIKGGKESKKGSKSSKQTATPSPSPSPSSELPTPSPSKLPTSVPPKSPTSMPSATPSAAPTTGSLVLNEICSTYESVTGTPAQVEFDEISALTCDHIEMVLVDAIAMAAPEVLVLERVDCRSSSMSLSPVEICYEVVTVFATSSQVVLTEDEIGELFCIAVTDPTVESLLDDLKALPASNPFSNTTGLTCNEASVAPSILSTSDAPTSFPSLEPSPEVLGRYDITQDLLLPTQDLPLFEAAGAKWESLIVGDLEDWESTRLFNPPKDGCTYPEIIGTCTRISLTRPIGFADHSISLLLPDDLYICGVVEPIDGEDMVIGRGRALYIRNDNRLTVAGEMIFDEADLDYLREVGLLQDLILHEMGTIIQA